MGGMVHRIELIVLFSLYVPLGCSVEGHVDRCLCIDGLNRLIGIARGGRGGVYRLAGRGGGGGWSLFCNNT